MENSQDLLWSNFCRLGEMIGDGLHHEEPWITKEYNRLSKVLMPDMHRDIRKKKNEAVNEAMSRKLATDRCLSCGGIMKQTRSGSFVVKCVECNNRYRYKRK